MNGKMNYKGIFVAGCTLVASGVVLSIILGPVGIGILGSGLGLMAVGLANREKWNQED